MADRFAKRFCRHSAHHLRRVFRGDALRFCPTATKAHIMAPESWANDERPSDLVRSVFAPRSLHGSLNLVERSGRLLP
jgi:hypothetical protein